ncbi:MAG: M1 family aminopeptidase, partial [Bacteroidales bacterium]|nr:M1 family aminopeptidase [Bacteroidales bacterium]
MKFYRLYTVMPKLSLLIMPRFLPMIVPILLILFLFSCEGGRVQRLAVSGVSEELAVSRKENIRDIVYSLKFAIPFERDSAIMANVVIDFSLDKRDFVVLDFKPSYELLGDSQKVHDGHLVAIVNGAKISLGIQNEHIIIPKKYLKKGANSLSLNFVAGEQSLNRRQDLLYTLLVPDRARTLFPCFDQPNLKAKFNLSLDIPASWMALANGKVIDESIIVNKEEVKNAEGVKILKFSQTEPISTYLFSFVVGDFEIITESREGREISIYHKESDPAKVAQSKEIFDLIYSSLEWLEEFTAIDYPFTKYDIAIVPGFQYGGMEHMGATLYSDRRMFLEESS